MRCLVRDGDAVTGRPAVAGLPRGKWGGRSVQSDPSGAPREFLQPCTLREDEVARIEAVGADRAIAFEESFAGGGEILR